MSALATLVLLSLVIPPPITCHTVMGGRSAAVCPVSVMELRVRKVPKVRKVCTHPPRYDRWDAIFRQR
jgi:hypothetical protein